MKYSKKNDLKYLILKIITTLNTKKEKEK